MTQRPKFESVHVTVSSRFPAFCPLCYEKRKQIKNNRDVSLTVIQEEMMITGK